MLRTLFVGGILLLLSGCATHGLVENAPGDGVTADNSYSVKTFMGKWRSHENALMLAFSGGGTRAAALSYGVLKELRDTPIVDRGQGNRLLDEVHIISSVSGGSFTSAYYGLHGDGIFDDYEEVFLRKNVQGELIKRALNPLRWFGSGDRTERAVDYYQKAIFKDATFADMLKQDGPLITINASDLGYGVRFSFLQEYFNLLCSDLSTFPVARAVTASSAVPVLFHPVVIGNFPDCGSEYPEWLKKALIAAENNPENEMVVQGLESYYDRDKRKYAHFVDGGITDNLGLRAIYEIIEMGGGIRDFNRKHGRQPVHRLVIISVDASTEPTPKMDGSNKRLSLEETIGAMSNVQLHRYNVATIELMKGAVNRWARELSTPEHTVEPYFIRIDFGDIKDPEQRDFFNQVPTSFRLNDEQVDRLILAGRELLRNNPEFRRLVADLQAEG